MNLVERINILTKYFDKLQNTNSYSEKEAIISELPLELYQDFYACIEAICGERKFGYTYNSFVYGKIDKKFHEQIKLMTIKEVLDFLQEPYISHNLTRENIESHILYTIDWANFFEPIVNRTLKIGIGKSYLVQSKYKPMLAKKYNGKLPISYFGYSITEKLDGNRCIAYYKNNKWNFISRNGKIMYVDFDMEGLPTEYIYDGEVMSKGQTENSKARNLAICTNTKYTSISSDNFNKASGAINNHSYNNELCYNIFDIQLLEPYRSRRIRLTNLNDTSNVRILPLLYHCSTKDELEEYCNKTLPIIVSYGGEGLMINTEDAVYQHKRTNDLLKVKQIQSMDMRVISIEYGKGRNIGLVGALNCQLVTNDGHYISCKVGTGLTDNERLTWGINPELIINKIVEVQYFSLFKNKKANEIEYSLRFPCFKGIRNDKSKTSEY